MLVAIERKSRSGRPAVPHSPLHRQAAQLIEAIADINKPRATRLRILNEELKGFQCLFSPSTPFLSIAPPVSFHLHLLCCKIHLEILCRLLLRHRPLYA